MTTDWNQRWMDIALTVSTWSKDPSKKIGAVAVRNNRLLAQGYNGLPKGFPDNSNILDNRELKYEFIIHAEENLILNAAKNGVCLEDATVYVYGLAPCSRCAGKLVTAGVKKIIYTVAWDDPRWNESQRRSQMICDNAGVDLVQLHLKDDEVQDTQLFSLSEEKCRVCGHTRSNHPYRHPFVAERLASRR